MIRLIAHDDVTQVECSTVVSRSLGYLVSAYLVRGVMVDTAFPLVGPDLEQWLDEVRPRGAFVTHYHEDHAGNVGRLARRGIPLGIATATEERVRAPGRIGLYRRVCWGSAPPVPRLWKRFADERLALLSAPGHTDDHHVVWDSERETMFGGDLFIGVKVRIAHAREDLRQQVRTLRAMAHLRPRRFFDAHRGALEHPVGELLAKAEWIELTIDAIERLVHAGRSDREISAAVLGRGDSTGWASAGDYSKVNFVRSVRRSMAPARDSLPRPAGPSAPPADALAPGP